MNSNWLLCHPGLSISLFCTVLTESALAGGIPRQWAEKTFYRMLLLGGRNREDFCKRALKKIKNISKGVNFKLFFNFSNHT